MKIYDLSLAMTEDLPVYPGDPAFDLQTISSVESGDAYGLSKICFGNHLGTHIDFPSHVIKGGKTSSDFSIEFFLGLGYILEIPENEPIIFPSVIGNILSKSSLKFLFLKTKTNPKKHIFLSQEAAILLKNSQIDIVGIDSPSIDSYDDPHLSVHRLLLSEDILIVENLNLCEIPEGEYKFSILPLKIPVLDGLPVRVVAEALG